MSTCVGPTSTQHRARLREAAERRAGVPVFAGVTADPQQRGATTQVSSAA